MATKKQRSVFWIVSTHVLTTGFVMPTIAGVLGSNVIWATQLSVVATFMISLAFQSIGYIGGTYYSLSYIRKVALIENPVACIKPSIITFAVLALIGFGVNVACFFVQEKQGVNLLWIIMIGAFYIVIGVAFAKITQQGFSRMEPHVMET